MVWTAAIPAALSAVQAVSKSASGAVPGAPISPPINLNPNVHTPQTVTTGGITLGTGPPSDPVSKSITLAQGALALGALVLLVRAFTRNQ